VCSLVGPTLLRAVCAPDLVRELVEVTGSRVTLRRDLLEPFCGLGLVV
jgi:hypothetical protein